MGWGNQGRGMTDVVNKISVSIGCAGCGGKVRLGETGCSTCGRPATPDELAALQRRWEAADPEAARRASRVQLGRVLIPVVGGLSAVWGLVVWGVIDFKAAAFQFIVAAAFALLFATSFRWRLRSTIGAAVFYLLAWTIQFLLAPGMGAGGVLGKGLTLAGLIAGCIAEIQTRRARKALTPPREPRSSPAAG